MARTAGELLGFPASAPLVLVNCDDLGTCPEATLATVAALRTGRATSATLIVPATHAADAARLAAGLPVGVHLALNSEWEADRWRPLTDAPSLCDADGGLCRRPQDTCDRAVTAQARAELGAQVEQALAWGIDVTHLDAHMYVVQERADLFDAYLDLACAYALPVRVSGSVAQAGHPFRRLARERGVACPDHLVRLGAVGSREPVMRALEALPPGLTEFHLHPADDSPGLRALASDWRGRVDDAALLADPAFRAAVERSGATVVGYRGLRDAARALSAAP